MDEAMRLLFQREQARQAKDFSTADSLRDRLQELGVTLFDKTQSWRSADGRTGRIPSFNDLEAGLPPEALLTTDGPRGFAGSVIEGTEAHIKSLVQQREQARSIKDFPRSDQLRDELKSMGVELFDKEKLWRAKDGRSGVIIGYKGTPTDMEITTLVMQREKARQANDYGTSDMIRDELKEFSITIDDKAKVWRAPDGRQGPVPAWGQIITGAIVGAAAAPAMVVSGPAMHGGRSAIGAPDVKQQLMQAAMHAAARPDTAARALALLQQHGLAGPVGASMGMHTVVPASTPLRVHAVGKPAVVSRRASCPEATEAFAFMDQCRASGRTAIDDPSEIDWLVGLREKVRQAKDFGAADDLRDMMKSTLGIELLEKEKLWKTDDGLQGNIPLWNSLM